MSRLPSIDFLKATLQIGKLGYRKEQYLDIYDPCYGGTIEPDHVFRVESMADIPERCPALIVIRETGTNNRVIVVPMEYRSAFTVPAVFNAARDILRIDKTMKKYFDLKSGCLLEGDYTLTVRVAVDEVIQFARPQRFTVVRTCDQVAGQQRMYCVKPWNTLLLREFGAAPCCNLLIHEHFLYNANFEGSYDPWQSEGFRALRDSISSGNPVYCHRTCPHLTLKPEDISSFFKHSRHGLRAERKMQLMEKRRLAYVRGDRTPATGPSEISLLMGNACNLKCRFCVLPAQKNPHTIYGKSMLALIGKYGADLHKLRLVGGEPTLYLKYIEELRRFTDEDTVFEFTTNGVLLDRLASYNLRNLSLKVSLNVADRETYEWLHGYDFFDRVVEGIRSIRRKNEECFLTLKFMIMRSTYRQIIRFAELAKALGVDVCTFGILLFKRRANIDVGEKLVKGEKEWHEANLLLREAEEVLSSSNTAFEFSGWDYRPDELS